MDMDWNRLRVLDAVARTGSVVRAAEVLHMSGPAISQQLRKIESEANTKVVVPHGRGLRLTNDGIVLARYAAEVAALMQQADNDLHREDQPVGHVRVAALASALRGRLAPAIAEFQRRHARLHVNLEDGETMHHLERLSGGRLDVVIAESWSPVPLRLPTGTATQVIASDPVEIALSAQHPLVEQKTVGLSMLADEVWVTCAEGSDGHVAIDQSARRLGFELNFRYFLADHMTQLAIVKQGLAVAALPVPEGATGPTGIVYRKLVPQIRRDLLLVTSNRTQSRAVETLISTLANPHRMH